MKNKILAFLLIAVLVCALPPATVLASNGTVENVKTFKFAAGVTTQADIDASLGDGIIECTSSEVGGQTIYTIKLLKNIVMAPGHDFRVNEYNSGGMSLPPVCLDLNGCTITSQSIGLITDGRLTIMDSSEEQTGGITYSTDSDKSSLVVISNGGELIINGGTFRCESGYAFTGYVAAVSTQGGTAQINGGTFYSNSSAVLSSNGGVTTVNGGNFYAPYGLYAKAGSNGAGEIIVSENSTAVVDAESFAMVIQRNDSGDGKITVKGGTFHAPKTVGGVGGPDTQAAISIDGGSYDSDPRSWVPDGTPVAQSAQSGTAGQYLVGENTVEETAADMAEGDILNVLCGDVKLTDVPDGVVIQNSGDGTVSFKGTEIPKDDSITVCNHVWGEWQSGNDGTHSRTCQKPGCTASETQQCSGGKATCTERAVCSVCKGQYGNLTAHTPTVIGAKDPTCAEEGYTGNTVCAFCGEILEEGKPVQKLTHNYKDGVCTVCGATDPDYVPFVPEIIQGADGTWQKGDSDGLSFTSNAAFEDFQKVLVDGKDVVVGSECDVTEGSTIVVLRAGYLETLSAGKHTLSVVSDTGTATTEFTVEELPITDDSQPPQTGYDSGLVLWAVVLFVSGGVFSAVTYMKKKQAD